MSKDELEEEDLKPSLLDDGFMIADIMIKHGKIPVVHRKIAAQNIVESVKRHSAGGYAMSQEQVLTENNRIIAKYSKDT